MWAKSNVCDFLNGTGPIDNYSFQRGVFSPASHKAHLCVLGYQAKTFCLNVKIVYFEYDFCDIFCRPRPVKYCSFAGIIFS